MNSVKILGNIFYISGFLLILAIILINPINLLIDILILIGFSLITLAFIIIFNFYEKRGKKHEKH